VASLFKVGMQMSLSRDSLVIYHASGITYSVGIKTKMPVLYFENVYIILSLRLGGIDKQFRIINYYKQRPPPPTGFSRPYINQ